LSYLRNTAISQFLRTSGFDYYCQLDCDLILGNTQDGDNVFDKLVAAHVDFVTGLYANRTLPGMMSASCPLYDLPITPTSGLVELRWAGGGCWMIRRDVIERMAVAYPETAYDSPDGICYGLADNFILKMHDGQRRWLSEDYAFSERFRRTGGRIWADTSVSLGHVGTKEMWLWPRKA
jgi:hypothetical protein